jgi:hypothetical protein
MTKSNYLKKERLEEESRLVGDFGELVLAFYLTKLGINVIRADTVFFDLIAKDKNRIIFKNGNLVGISIKIRDRSVTTPSCTIQLKEYEKIKSFGEKWGLEPWICFIIVFRKEGKRILQGFLFPYEDGRGYMSHKKRKNAISFSKLREATRNGKIKENEFFEWII